MTTTKLITLALFLATSVLAKKQLLSQLKVTDDDYIEYEDWEGDLCVYDFDW